MHTHPCVLRSLSIDERGVRERFIQVATAERCSIEDFICRRRGVLRAHARTREKYSVPETSEKGMAFIGDTKSRRNA